jgi:hypothetical protein
MKKIISILALLMLSSCTLVDAYLMTHYDPNEYQAITSIRAEAQLFKSQCDDPIISKANASKLATDTQFFVLYSEHVPRNADLISASNDLNAIAKGLTDQYEKANKVSPAFCKIKFTTVETSADRMQTVISGRPR